ncbi:aspartate--ammonia ligase [Candidatus Woesearchaeota archaeon]|nr:aspartate--ammonia ligase [Candidatus Woesearchaeota archaeon]
MNSFPKKYKPKLNLRETEKAIKFVKDEFELSLSEMLNLERVSAPRFLETGTGLQDDLAGTQNPVRFETKFSKSPIEVVHSLAKWKRDALGRYGFQRGTGLYTDMDAIRKDEDISPIHSIYVDQWDWEKVIGPGDRHLIYLENTVQKIYAAMGYVNRILGEEFPVLKRDLPPKMTFVHSEDLANEFPNLTPHEREHELARKYGAAFLIGIGYPLDNGNPHDLRAADYDDWSSETSDGKYGLNGDIIVWDDVRETSLELSSMGIRVDSDSLSRQLQMHNLMDRLNLEFHKGIILNKLPLTIGGGIGQSRLCMYFLQKAHIGEVQSSVWPKKVKDDFNKQGVGLL